jgi:hypothetical protein
VKRNWEVSVAQRSFSREVVLAKRYAALYKNAFPRSRIEVSESFNDPYIYLKGGLWYSVRIEEFVRVCRMPPEKLVQELSGDLITRIIAKERLKCTLT